MKTIYVKFSRATIRAMTNMQGIIRQLEQERDRIDSAIQALRGVGSSGATRSRRTLSVAARQRIAAAQRARWAKVKAGKK
jgi:transcription initiation factor TFIIIB Brf1 subunit/transcription initiation factor TFIIB